MPSGEEALDCRELLHAEAVGTLWLAGQNFV